MDVAPSDVAPSRPRWRRIDFILFAIVLLVGLLTRLPTMARQFQRDPEGCGAFYGTVARNYSRYGILKTYAVPIQSIGVTPEAPVFYPNHPPLLPLLVAGAYRVFGWNPWNGDVPPEWQTRLPTTLFTLACIATIFVMLRSRANLRAATFAALVFALVPMTILFGSQPDVINTQLVFFALLTIAAYERLQRSQNWKTLGLLCLAFAPAAATDWPAFHLAVVLGLHFIATRPLRRWGWIIAFGFVCAAYFFLLYGEVVAVTHDWRWMSRIFIRRAMSSESDARKTITIGNWFRDAIGHHAIGRHTMIGFALLGAWIVLAARPLRRSPASQSIWLLLAWVTLHVLVGRQGVFVHEWWWWPLTPGLAMACGVAIDWLLSLLERQRVDHRVVTAAAAILILAFGAWNMLRVRHELAHPFPILENSRLDYSVMEMGEAIRAAAAPGEAVMLAESDETLALWFYADRPIKRNVWDPYTFEQRLYDGIADLQFGLTEPWTKRPVAVVVPKAYLSPKLEPFVDYLKARYPMHESGKFLSFALKPTQ
jgi:4-amino-4-deoxy-L-arabinose transferase-like glycosyltransferase